VNATNGGRPLPGPAGYEFRGPVEAAGIGPGVLAASPAGNPWFIATLFDAYFGFLWFWLWVAYKETSWLARIVWLALILTLGNIAMASYMLIQLFRLSAGAKIEDLLLRRSA